MGSRVDQSLFWPASRHGQGLAGPRKGSGLLLAGCGGWWFSFIWCLPPKWVSGPETRTGFLKGSC